jgi:hypothetical protein
MERRGWVMIDVGDLVTSWRLYHGMVGVVKRMHDNQRLIDFDGFEVELPANKLAVVQKGAGQVVVVLDRDAVAAGDDVSSHARVLVADGQLTINQFLQHELSYFPTPGEVVWIIRARSPRDEAVYYTPAMYYQQSRRGPGRIFAVGDNVTLAEMANEHDIVNLFGLYAFRGGADWTRASKSLLLAALATFPDGAWREAGKLIIGNEQN